MPTNTRLMPGPQEFEKVVDDNGRVTQAYDPNFYLHQLPQPSPFGIPTVGSDQKRIFDTAAAKAKDRARNKLAAAIQREAARLQAEQRSAFVISPGRDTFVGQAHANVTRSIDGVADAPLNDIKL